MLLAGPLCAARHLKGQHQFHDRTGETVKVQALVDGRATPATKHHLQGVAGVKRRVDKGLCDPRLAWVFGACVAGNAPKTLIQIHTRRCVDLCDGSVRVHVDCDGFVGARPFLRFVEHYRAVLDTSARPGPTGEVRLKGSRSGVRVGIAVPLPGQAGFIDVGFDAAEWGVGPPMVTRCRVQREMGRLADIGRETNLTLEPQGPRHGHLIDVNHERVALPAQGAWPDGEMVGPIIERAFASLGHRPTGFGAIERDVDRDVIIGVVAP